MIDVVDGVREGGTGGRGLEAGGSLESVTGAGPELGLVCSCAGLVPARRGGGNGGGFEDVVDDEFVGDGCLYFDNSSEIDVDRFDSVVEDLDLTCPWCRAAGRAGGLRFETTRPWRVDGVDGLSAASVASNELGSMEVGEAVLGGGGKGLLRSLEVLGVGGRDGSAKDGDFKLGPGGDDDRLSKATVSGIFCLTSFP